MFPEIRELANEDPLSVREAITQQLQKGGHATLTETLHDLHAQYDDLRKLEDSVLELRDLFLYLGALVDEQGRLLDNIELNVNNTEEYTGAAVVHLERAKEHKESYDSKRWWFWLISWGTVIVILIIVGICVGPALMACCGGGKDK